MCMCQISRVEKQRNDFRNAVCLCFVCRSNVKMHVGDGKYAPLNLPYGMLHG